MSGAGRGLSERLRARSIKRRWPVEFDADHEELERHERNLPTGQVACRVWSLHGFACQIAFALRGHRRNSSDPVKNVATQHERP